MSTWTRAYLVTTSILSLTAILARGATSDSPPAGTKSDPARTISRTGEIWGIAQRCAGLSGLQPDQSERQIHLPVRQRRPGRALLDKRAIPASWLYLLENGHLFRTAEATNRNQRFRGPAIGGRLQEFDWDGNLVWDFEYHSDKRLPHHDAIKLPNGNALLICWEMIDETEAVAQGRRPETVKDSHLQPDCLVEIRPTGPKTGEVVWEWRSWDHLIQDRDRTKPNFGKVADHPERIDLNYIPA